MYCKVRTSSYLMSLGCHEVMSLITGRRVKGLHKLGACFQVLACIILFNLQSSQLTGELTHLLRSNVLSDNSSRAGCATWRLIIDLSYKQRT